MFWLSVVKIFEFPPVRPEAWAQIFKHLVDGVRLSFLGLEARFWTE